MIAFDTNIVVRLLTNDDPVQSSRAAALLESDSVFVPLSVLLETDWVLRSIYGLDRAAVAGALRNLLGLPAIQAEATGRVAQALSWYEQGFDFAGALHLTSAIEAGTGALATFDGKFRRLAAEHAVMEVVEP